MLQTEFLAEILKKCRENGINTAVDTAGDTEFECFEKAIPYTDIFLYDIKALSDNIHIKYTGASNKRILENLRRISEDGRCDIIIRIPVIPTVNDNPKELKKITDFIKKINCKKIEFLPYNPMAKYKYDALDMEFYNYVQE